MSPQMKPQATTAAQALDRCNDDPAFEAALRAAYHGRHDVLDALWWAAHPLTDSPRGVADPARGLLELQRAVFSRAAADSPMVEVTDPETGAMRRLRESEHRLQEAERTISGDAQHLTDVLGAVGLSPTPVTEVKYESAGREPQPAVISIASSPAGPDNPQRDTNDSQAVQEDDNAPPAVTPDARRKFLLPALAGMGLLAAILLLPTLSELDAGADSESPPPSTTAPRITTEIVTIGADGKVSDPLEILERPLAESDHPPTGFDEMHAAGSFRALPGMVAHTQLYLARGVEPETICLAVVRPDLAGMSSCVSESTFLDEGIHLSGGRYGIDANETILTESYSLLPTGEFHYEATARVRTDPVPPEGSPELEGGVEGG
ncbi:MAG TPA: hypothetical protein VFT01_05775 [Homoserinimonas sp.]|nr:hypothetical protein [Homoserinimonas sp.]